jgi:hypothetical protein
MPLETAKAHISQQHYEWISEIEVDVKDGLDGMLFAW